MSLFPSGSHLQLRTFGLVLGYALLFCLSLSFAYLLRFDFQIEAEWVALLYENLLWIIPLKVILFFSTGQFKGMPSYFRLPDLFRTFWTLVAISAFLIVLWYGIDGRQLPPRSVILADFVFSLVFVCGLRTLLRILRENDLAHYFTGRHKALLRVAIIGAGDAGASIAADMLTQKSIGMLPVLFLDDDKQKWGQSLHGIEVIGGPELLESVKRHFEINEVIIAMPFASGQRIHSIVAQAQELELQVKIIPSLAELTTGLFEAKRIRSVQIEDLLGREPIDIDSDTIQSIISGEVVMVTGAGGSIGAELCRQILHYGPRQLLLVERSEIQLFQVEQQLIEDGYQELIIPLPIDILDEKRMRCFMERYQPNILFHAAAHKHVGLMERDPGAAVKNNALGTQGLADLSSELGIQRFVLISTDKAINPTAAMGASKRLAEIYIQAKNYQSGNTTRFNAVRFGNVLGSSGSVVPIFHRQIERGGPVTVTHPEVTRYFMTIPEAVGLVLQSASQGKGGEIFVLDMGQSIKIIDLARQMIALSGLRPGIDIMINFIGLRPGEKLSEELKHRKETLKKTEHPRILRFVSSALPWARVATFFNRLRAEVDGWQADEAKQELKGFIKEYEPDFSQTKM